MMDGNKELREVERKWSKSDAVLVIFAV
jgi:hypothetical protein